MELSQGQLAVILEEWPHLESQAGAAAAAAAAATAAAAAAAAAALGLVWAGMLVSHLSRMRACSCGYAWRLPLTATSPDKTPRLDDPETTSKRPKDWQLQVPTLINLRLGPSWALRTTEAIFQKSQAACFNHTFCNSGLYGREEGVDLKSSLGSCLTKAVQLERSWSSGCRVRLFLAAIAKHNIETWQPAAYWTDVRKP